LAAGEALPPQAASSAVRMPIGNAHPPMRGLRGNDVDVSDVLMSPLVRSKTDPEFN
jgi:hypothetical protein